MSAFYGRRELIRRINELHRSNQHVSVIGARAIGKTALLKAVVAQHAKGSDLFAGAGLVDLRQDPPTSADLALRRVATVLREVFRSATTGELKDLAGQVDLDASPDDLYNQLKIALELVHETAKRVLLVLDGCDPVLQNSAIPRNLWDGLRALGEIGSLRFITGSREALSALCYNPDARVSPFFNSFYHEPIFVGPLDENDWGHFASQHEGRLDQSACKEIRNWTGGRPDLVEPLTERLYEHGRGPFSKDQVDAAAESILNGRSGRLDWLWRECSDETRGDILHLAHGELFASEMPTPRLRLLAERGIAAQSGNKVRLTSRFIQRFAVERRSDVSGARSLFEKPEDFATNIRSVLELRLAHVRVGDPALTRLINRAIKPLPDDPDASLGSARDILDRALDIVWAYEAPGEQIPQSWIDHWRAIEVSTGRPVRATLDYASRTIPEERGFQCALLRVATGQNRIRPITARVSKTTCVLIEHVNQLGDLKNHSRVTPSVTLAVAFCLAAIELVDALARELA